MTRFTEYRGKKIIIDFIRSRKLVQYCRRKSAVKLPVLRCLVCLIFFFFSSDSVSDLVA